MFRVEYAYFDRKGEQKRKTVECKTRKGLISAVRKVVETKDFYRIVAVSPNLGNDMDFEPECLGETND